MDRAVIHIDLDAFFAAVEVLENPALAGKPVIVAGSPQGRGVVSSASYPARAFGIHSAMPTGRALALCPDVIVVSPRHRVYRTYSRRVMDILYRAAAVVEPTSIDEAFLEVTEQVAAWDEAVEMARKLQRQVSDEVGLSASLGVATNKLVAKVASERDKPGGLTVVRPGTEAAFLAPLSVRVLWGIGPVTAEKLARIGVTTASQLAKVEEAVLRQHFGRHGAAMARHAQGIDHRPLVTEHQARSISHETTFDRDLADSKTVYSALQDLSQGVARRLKRSGLAGGTIGIKLRYADFTTLTRQMSLDVPTDDGTLIYETASVLLRRTWQRDRRVRLLGVCVGRLAPSAGQLPLW